MENKVVRANHIYQQKGLFFTIGFILSSLLVIVALEWKTYPEQSLIDEVEDSSNWENALLFPVEIIEKPKMKKVKKFQLTTIGTACKKTSAKHPKNAIEIPVIEEVEVEEEMPPPLPVTKPLPRLPPVSCAIGCTLPISIEPAPIAGFKHFYRYIAQHLHYPAKARKEGITGKVVLQFIVEKDGSLTNIKVLSGIEGGCNEEAVRVLRNAPHWKPGKQRGRPIKVRRTLPIVFKFK